MTNDHHLNDYTHAEIEIMNRDEAVAVFGIGFVQDLESME